MSSQPSAIPRFSAAMAGCLTHSWRRVTLSAWRFTISAWIAACASSAASEKRGRVITAAPAAAAPRKSRRVNSGMARSLAQPAPARRADALRSASDPEAAASQGTSLGSASTVAPGAANR